MIFLSFYQRMKDLREDADKTQAEVAKALFMQLTQYGRYERGERELPLNVAVAIAKYYGVSLDYLAELSNVKPLPPVSAETAEEHELLKGFRRLDDFGKGQVFERVKMLTEKKKSGS